jgi:hypothetical protein
MLQKQLRDKDAELIELKKSRTKDEWCRTGAIRISNS